MTTGGTAKSGATGFPGDDNYQAAPAGELDPELAKLLDLGLAKGWLPRPGDKVGGTLVDRYTGESDYGIYPILEIEQANGEVIAVHGFHTVLRGQIERKDPQPGDRVGVTYYGPQDADKARKGSPAEMYRLVVIPAVRPAPTAVSDEPF